MANSTERPLHRFERSPSPSSRSKTRKIRRQRTNETSYQLDSLVNPQHSLSDFVCAKFGRDCHSSRGRNEGRFRSISQLWMMCKDLPTTVDAVPETMTNTPYHRERCCTLQKVYFPRDSRCVCSKVRGGPPWRRPNAQNKFKYGKFSLISQFIRIFYISWYL
jgi:hypothetical protein